MKGSQSNRAAKRRNTPIYWLDLQMTNELLLSDASIHTIAVTCLPASALSKTNPA